MIAILCSESRRGARERKEKKRVVSKGRLYSRKGLPVRQWTCFSQPYTIVSAQEGEDLMIAILCGESRRGAREKKEKKIGVSKRRSYSRKGLLVRQWTCFSRLTPLTVSAARRLDDAGNREGERRRERRRREPLVRGFILQERLASPPMDLLLTSH
jgi:hypothetical protein